VKVLLPALIVLLLVVRLPSLAQPAGADQGLYAYVGQRIAQGELPYRAAWDQKPPAVHYTYAVMFGLWAHDGAVAAADLVVAGTVALLLVALGRRLSAAPGAGYLAAALFLLLGNPALTRLGGVRVRGQCEIFIGLAVAAALLCLHRALAARGDGHEAIGRWLLAAGALLGLAALYKYNAAAYLPAALAGLIFWASPGDARRVVSTGLPLVAGFALPVAAMLLVFGLSGAFWDLYHATITYNLLYSGETYGSSLEFIRYLLTFPVRHARVDPLWLVGGLGCAVLLVMARREPHRAIAPLWVAAACLSIAINGSRGLPQYFVQAAPALGLAAGIAGAELWSRLGRPARVALLVVVGLAVVRVTTIDRIVKVADYAAHDTRYLSGRLSRAAYLERFGGQREEDKFSAAALAELAGFLRERTAPDEAVYVFGFSPGAYVQARRESASRFFWSRPVIVEFRADQPGYGPAGLLADLERTRPRVVALQRHDWMDTVDSLTYFLQHDALAGWLQREYEPAADFEEYAVWTRRTAPAGRTGDAAGSVSR
jgi:hypothetical protein